VTGKQLIRHLKKLGAEEVRRESSHVRMRFGVCSTTVPVHAGEDLGKGLLRAIERDLAPCLGEGWLK